MVKRKRNARRQDPAPDASEELKKAQRLVHDITEESKAAMRALEEERAVVAEYGRTLETIVRAAATTRKVKKDNEPLLVSGGYFHFGEV